MTLTKLGQEASPTSPDVEAFSSKPLLPEVDGLSYKLAHKHGVEQKVRELVQKITNYSETDESLRLVQLAVLLDGTVIESHQAQRILGKDLAENPEIRQSDESNLYKLTLAAWCELINIKETPSPAETLEERIDDLESRIKSTLEQYVEKLEEKHKPKDPPPPYLASATYSRCRLTQQTVLE